MTVLQIALLILAAIALGVTVWANWRISQRARDFGQRWISDPMSARDAALNPEYRTLNAAGAVFMLCLIILGLMALA